MQETGPFKIKLLIVVDATFYLAQDLATQDETRKISNDGCMLLIEHSPVSNHDPLLDVVISIFEINILNGTCSNPCCRLSVVEDVEDVDDGKKLLRSDS